MSGKRSELFSQTITKSIRSRRPSNIHDASIKCTRPPPNSPRRHCICICVVFIDVTECLVLAHALPVVLPDSDNVGKAVGISLISRIDIRYISCISGSWRPSLIPYAP